MAVLGSDPAWHVLGDYYRRLSVSQPGEEEEAVEMGTKSHSGKNVLAVQRALLCF